MRINTSNILLLIFLSLFCVVNNVSAQYKSLSGYLEGAVPEEDGKVVFRESFSIPGIHRDSLMKLTDEWINGRNNPEEGRLSRVVFVDDEKGAIVGNCSEKLVFKASFLVLDQADIQYYVHAVCNTGSVDLAIMMIRYEYQNDQRFTAEELITDKVSLDKDKKKLKSYSKKWRIKTIDFVKDFFEDYNNFLFRNKRKDTVN